MFRLETDLSGISITRLVAGKNEKIHNCTLMYAMYKSARPIPNSDKTVDNYLTLWTDPFVTRNDELTHISLWETGVLYRLPQTALDELMEGNDLCAAPLRIEFRHIPYPGFAVDEYDRGSADGKRDAVTTALHIGAYTPCIVAPRYELIDWIDYFGSRPCISPFITHDMEKRGLHPHWLEPFLYAGDVRIEHLPGLLDYPVELIREAVSRETA